MTILLRSIMRLLPALILALLAVVPICAQQPTSTLYQYDKNGRLVKVILPNGRTVVYEYDPAGNIMSVTRFGGPPLSIISFNPTEGITDDQVTITGSGFEINLADNQVFFNNVAAQVVSVNSTETEIVAKVPAGATTGPIKITTPSSSVTSSDNFTILSVTVSPAAVTILPNQTAQFTATVPASFSQQNVTWSVNGINGGNSSVGTISSNGLYTAPNIFSMATFTIRATSVARPTIFAEATATVNPDLYPARAAAVSIQHGYLTGIKGDAVAIRRGPINEAINILPFSMAVSIMTGPVISAISPSNLTRATSTSVTISGQNLTGTTSLNFISSDGTVDTTISASNINVSADGNSLTVTITSSSSTALGSYVVIVKTSNANSSRTSLSTNSIQIVTP